MTGYYRNCDFSNCNFTNAEFDCVAFKCKFDGSDFSLAKIGRLYSPKSTFKNCTFRKGFAHKLAHSIMGVFNVRHNHEIIAEIIRQYINNTDSLTPTQKVEGLKHCQTIENRTDLSWAELGRMLPDEIIVHGFHAFRGRPNLHHHFAQYRPELEPDDMKNERLDTLSRE